MTKLDPWTVMARFKLMVEDELPTVPGLNYVILRPAIVYGIGDKNGLSKSCLLSRTGGNLLLFF